MRKKKRTEAPQGQPEKKRKLNEVYENQSKEET
jgi:hypothetical protein